MKKTIIIAALAAASAFGACNSNPPAQEKNATATHSLNNPTASTATSEPATLEPSFKGVDTKVAGNINTLVSDYIQLKDALTAGNTAAAKKAAVAMTETMKKVDKSLLTPEQRKVYDAAEDHLNGYAEKISGNPAIDAQRSQFAGMSEALYPLVKAFGGGRTLYHDHCPMYGDNGAMWISEIKEIKNPYMGADMRSCGEVMEIIK